MSIKGTCDPKEEFFIAVLALLVVPLAPLFIELYFKESVSAGVLLVSAIMYVAALSFSTDKKFIFIIGFIVVAYLCIMYGAALGSQVNANAGISASMPSDLQGAAVDASQKKAYDVPLSPEDPLRTSSSVYNSAIIFMVLFGLAQLFQRWRMHMRESQPFLDFRVRINSSEDK